MARIRDVWAHNLEIEMRNIREVIDGYPYVAMDTEFPGVVARPIGTFKTSSDYHYQTLRCNVDLLKIIQLGITLSDEEGHNPPECSTWQFNFKFNLQDDMYAPDSLDQLEKAGFDFQRHDEIGILPNDFAELMITSGLVLTNEATWISFHSGYDFGYFIKLLTAKSLPTSEDEFFKLLNIWFPAVYDIKVLMRANKNLKGGLQQVANDLGILQQGNPQQAGSDSLLAAAVFFKIRELYFNDQIDEEEYSGKLYGLGQTFSLTNGSFAESNLGGATLAERDDRGASIRDVHNQTPGPVAAVPQTPGVLNLGSLQGGPLQSAMTPGYGPLVGANSYGIRIGGGR
ncbi:CAF1-domain-containing protein [Coprinopsis marcescibilis]|uniref:poly(A)-specific ribonuclease n=1 Tax=Coprinopsis marcescibilis TaxID=230819 RepID=A0A5C3KSG1_COPMA|nr:CAF1-domain-containing protein [Coprinopsis marcescibilis]